MCHSTCFDPYGCRSTLVLRKFQCIGSLWPCHAFPHRNTAHFSSPSPNLPNLDVTVARVDTPRGDMPIPLSNGGHAQRYREVLEGSATPLLTDQQGGSVAVQNQSSVYLGAYLQHETLIQFYNHLLTERDIETLQLPQGLRKRVTKTEEFWFNYDCETMDTPHGKLEPAGVLRVPRKR